MFTITKEFTFSASHQLSGLPESHQCSRLHGHNYKVEIVLQSEKLNNIGFIVDYGELKRFKEYIDNNLDHRHLNDVLKFNPTAENMAAHFYHMSKPMWDEVVEVRVSETDKTWASYREVYREI